MFKNRTIFYSKRNHLNLIIIISVLFISGFTHLWNPVGFPSIHPDEGTYVRRSLQVASGQGPQDSEGNFDHPYFGQMFLGFFLYVIGYPQILEPSQEPESIGMLYFVPRVFMGLLGILDTFLIYLISSKRYNQAVGISASLLFAVMPLSWITRRVYLDSLLLPFFLSSILLAVYSLSAKEENKKILIWFSGLLLGVAIFTKIPAFTMIPLVCYVIFSKNKHDLTSLACFFVPLFLIPLFWPGYAFLTNDFDRFLDGVLFQLDREDKPLVESFKGLFEIDPILLSLGIMGLFYAAFRKDFIPLLWIIPFIVFFYLINFSSWFHWIPVIPLLCISAAKLIVDLSHIIEKMFRRHRWIFKNLIIIELAIFGLISTTLLITSDVTTPMFESISFVSKFVEENEKRDNEQITIISGTGSSWILKDIFHQNNVFSNYLTGELINTEKIVLIEDNQLNEIISIDISKVEDWKVLRLINVYNNTKSIHKIEDLSKNDHEIKIYPYSNFRFSSPGTPIDIRTNF